MDTSKIIKGVVSNGRYTVTAPIVKEDYGLYLQIEGVELPETYQVDFSNSENSGTSVTMIGNADGVLIPHQFIDTGKDIFAFLYHVGADFGRTVYKFRIPNKVRPDRTNEEPTPEQASVIDQAISALNTAVAQTAQDVIDADTSAQSASADADRAEEARTDAQNYATQAEQARDDAQTYANNASASATASANSASQSAQIKADVEGMVSNAQGYANSASQSANASANSASYSQGYANNASASAQSASGYASSAQTSANTASAKAQDASTSAQTASAKASEASQSASQALTYKTDAESAKVASQTAQGLAESARDSAVQAKTDAESAKADAESARDEAVQAVASISGALDDKADVITDTASGSIASFTDGADNLPLKSLVVDINPIQDLSHGDPSPENLCPISGWTEVNVNHSDADTSNPTTITIQLGQTVYGGKLDVLSGELVIDRAMVDLGTLSNWRYNVGSTGAFDTQVALTPLAKSNTKCICSQYKTLDYPNQGNITNSDFCVAINKKDDGTAYTGAYVVGTLVVKDSRYSDVEAFKTAMSGVMLCYELAEPLTIQLTPNQVNSLLGVNNIFADTGDTEVTYRADPDLYIQRKVPVDDVQIDGTSIVENNVANVPIASENQLGMVQTVSEYGIGVMGGTKGKLKTFPSSSSQVKGGTNNMKPIVPYNQHESTFYGLAKAAGDTTQSQSSNAVGSYTDTAKVAIQKMLGIYQAPWELIREDTFTNEKEADHIITTDANGEAFELTDIRFIFWLPQQETVASKKDYGRITFEVNPNTKEYAYLGGWTQQAGEESRGGWAEVRQTNGMIELHYIRNTSGTDISSNMVAPFRLTNAWNHFVYDPNGRAYNRVIITKVTGTGRYRLYGRRKWN